MVLYDKIREGSNKGIGIALDYKQPILVDQKGLYTEDNLDEFLGVLHDVGLNLYQKRLDGDDVCSSFYDIGIKAWENEEIQEYLIKIRKEDQTYFLAFDNLHDFLESCE